MQLDNQNKVPYSVIGRLQSHSYIIQICNSNLSHEVHVPSLTSPNTEYLVVTGDSLHEPYCTCPAFQFQSGIDEDGNCKHINAALFHQCNWREDISSEAQDTSQALNKICPRCQGPTSFLVLD